MHASALTRGSGPYRAASSHHLDPGRALARTLESRLSSGSGGIVRFVAFQSETPTVVALRPRDPMVAFSCSILFFCVCLHIVRRRVGCVVRTPHKELRPRVGEGGVDDRGGFLSFWRCVPRLVCGGGRSRRNAAR